MTAPTPSAAEAMREAAAKVAEEESEYGPPVPCSCGTTHPRQRSLTQIKQAIAAAIRALPLPEDPEPKPRVGDYHATAAVETVPLPVEPVVECVCGRCEAPEDDIERPDPNQHERVVHECLEAVAAAAGEYRACYREADEMANDYDVDELEALNSRAKLAADALDAALSRLEEVRRG